MVRGNGLKTDYGLGTNGSITLLSSSGNALGFAYSLSFSGRGLSMSGGGQFMSYGYDGAGAVRHPLFIWTASAVSALPSMRVAT